MTDSIKNAGQYSLGYRHLGRLALVSLLFVGWSAQAEEGEHAEGHHDWHPNTIALFLGVTGEDRRETGAAVGLEYERRLNASFGIGGIVERTFGDLDFWIYAVSFAYHTGPWKIYAAPGIEDPDGGSGEELLRLGVEYGFEVGDYEIAPQFDYDIVNGENAIVFGVTIGRGF